MLKRRYNLFSSRVGTERQPARRQCWLVIVSSGSCLLGRGGADELPGYVLSLNDENVLQHVFVASRKARA